MTVYYTVVRTDGNGHYISEWVSGRTMDQALGKATAMTNAGFTVTVAVYKGKHFNRLAGKG